MSCTFWECVWICPLAFEHDICSVCTVAKIWKSFWRLQPPHIHRSIPCAQCTVLFYSLWREWFVWFVNADTVGTVYMFLLCSGTSQGIVRTYIQTLQEELVLCPCVYYNTSQYNVGFCVCMPPLHWRGCVHRKVSNAQILLLSSTCKCMCVCVHTRACVSVCVCVCIYV